MTMHITPRAAWRAKPPAGTIRTVPPSEKVDHWTHWNGGPLRLTDHRSCLTAVQRIQQQHINQGWADIGYNLLICPHGTVIEGRGIDAVGAHCPNHNRTGIGVQMMLGQGEPPPPAQLAAGRNLWSGLCDRSGKTLPRRGHRDGYPTTCPGPELWTWAHTGMPTTEGTPEMTPEETALLTQAATDAATAVRILATGQRFPESLPAAWPYPFTPTAAILAKLDTLLDPTRLRDALNEIGRPDVDVDALATAILRQIVTQ